MNVNYVTKVSLPLTKSSILDFEILHQSQQICNDFFYYYFSFQTYLERVFVLTFCRGNLIQRKNQVGKNKFNKWSFIVTYITKILKLSVAMEMIQCTISFECMNFCSNSIYINDNVNISLKNLKMFCMCFVCSMQDVQRNLPLLSGNLLKCIKSITLRLTI